jgi:hypothetical protein
MAERRLISRRDESVSPPNKMNQEIASAINRVPVQQEAPAHNRIMNARRNPKGAIMTIMHQNETVDLALQYHDIITTVARTDDKQVIDVEENESSERLKIHAVPLVRCMRIGAEAVQTMGEELGTENTGVTTPTQVRWLVNPSAIRQRRQNGEITASSVVFVVKASKVAKGVRKKVINAVGVWYRVEMYTNVGPHTICELCC